METHLPKKCSFGHSEPEPKSVVKVVRYNYLPELSHTTTFETAGILLRKHDNMTDFSAFRLRALWRKYYIQKKKTVNSTAAMSRLLPEWGNGDVTSNDWCIGVSLGSQITFEWQQNRPLDIGELDLHGTTPNIRVYKLAGNSLIQVCAEEHRHSGIQGCGRWDVTSLFPPSVNDNSVMNSILFLSTCWMEMVLYAQLFYAIFQFCA